MKTGYILFSVIFTDKKLACDKIIKEFDNKYGIYPDLCGGHTERNLRGMMQMQKSTILNYEFIVSGQPGWYDRKG